jgi:hypothetical protein
MACPIIFSKVASQILHFQIKRTFEAFSYWLLNFGSWLLCNYNK